MKKRSINKLTITLICVLMLSVAGCIGSVTPKKQLVMIYGAYNSQYAQYMTATGYTMDDSGRWKKAFHPDYTEDDRKILRKKKEILTRMYPMINIYDSMVVGVIPYSQATEQELLNLIDQLAALGGI